MTELLSTEQKLDPAFKARWVAALRSGEYQQAREVLRNRTGGFCCMGVALNLIDPEKWADEPKTDCGITGYDWDQCKFSETSDDLANAIGLPRNIVKDLTQRNDGTGDFDEHSFAQIADWIEANL